METADQIISAAGRDRVMAAFGVKVRVVQHHLARGVLPCEWFAALEEITGQELPRHLFSFKGVE